MEPVSFSYSYSSERQFLPQNSFQSVGQAQEPQDSRSPLKEIPNVPAVNKEYQPVCSPSTQLSKCFLDLISDDNKSENSTSEGTNGGYLSTRQLTPTFMNNSSETQIGTDFYWMLQKTIN